MKLPYNLLNFEQILIMNYIKLKESSVIWIILYKLILSVDLTNTYLPCCPRVDLINPEAASCLVYCPPSGMTIDDALPLSAL